MDHIPTYTQNSNNTPHSAMPTHHLGSPPPQLTATPLWLLLPPAPLAAVGVAPSERPLLLIDGLKQQAATAATIFAARRPLLPPPAICSGAAAAVPAPRQLAQARRQQARTWRCQGGSSGSSSSWAVATAT